MDKPEKHFLDTERKVIHLMLKSRDCIDELLNDSISPEYFDVHHQLLVRSIYSEFIDSDKKRLLTRNSYRQMLVDANAPGDLMQNLTVYDRCSIQAYATPDDLGHLKRLLVEGFISRECYVLFERFRKDSKKQGFLGAAHELSDDLKKILGITDTGRASFVSLSELKDEFIKDLETRRSCPDKVVRCHDYPEIDESVSVGFRPQHLTLFVADVGGNKTSLMLNVALSLYEHGHSVLFIPLEMGRLDLANRIVANRARVNFRKLAFPEMLTDEEWVRIRECKIWFEQQHQFCILDADERTSVGRLKAEIEKRMLGFKPEVVIIDYVANLKSDRRFERNDLEIGDILKSLRFLGKKHGFHIITAAQIGRDALKAMRDNDNSVPDSTSIRGSHEYSADSDTIFALLKVKDEPDKIKLVTMKARHGPSGQSKTLYVQPEYCLITSSENIGVLSSSADADILNLENDLNEPIDNIAAKVNQSKPPAVKFVSTDLDDISSIL